MDQTRSPNWDKWRHVPHVEVWRAVALSLNIDPDAVKINQNSWMATSLVFNESQEFRDRIFVAARNLGRSLTFGTAALGEPEKCSVEVSEFAAWAISIDWHVPEQFAALAKTKPQRSQVLQGELGGKAKTTALKLVLGMALAGYGYNPRAPRSGTAKEISDDLQQHGISVTDDTIREWLREAAEEVEWHPKNSA